MFNTTPKTYPEIKLLFPPKDNSSMKMDLSEIWKRMMDCENLISKRQTLCDNSQLNRFFMGYMFPFILALCLFGNSMNIMVYSLEYLRQCVAVKMLAAKAIMNTLFVLCLLPNAIRLICRWSSNSTWEHFYWTSWPYILFLANTFGTCAMWLTVLMTLERYLYVVYPIRSRNWCTHRNFYRLTFILFPLAILLQIVFPVTRKVDVLICISGKEFKFTRRSGTFYELYETVYHWLNLLLVIIIPLILLIFMTFVISFKLCYQRRFRHHQTTNEQYRCVTLITLSTTATHLLLETPAVGVFIAAAINGSQVINKISSLCFWNIGANFLALCNASVLCFIYLMFCRRFRQLFVIRLTCAPDNTRPPVRTSLFSSRDIFVTLRERCRLLPIENRTQRSHSAAVDVNSALTNGLDVDDKKRNKSTGNLHQRVEMIKNSSSNVSSDNNNLKEEGNETVKICITSL